MEDKMPEETKVWGIHTLDDNLFLKENVIAIGWNEIGDLSKIAPDREAFKKKYGDHCRFHKNKTLHSAR